MKAFIISVAIAMLIVGNIIMAFTLGMSISSLNSALDKQAVRELDDNVFYYAKTNCVKSGDASDAAILEFVSQNQAKCDSIQDQGLETFFVESITTNDIVCFTEDSAILIFAGEQVSARIDKDVFNALDFNKKNVELVLTYDCGDYSITMK